ncbi:MAG: hypothetical protein ACF8QF_05905 [Phycisphaerales bacterium]
MMRSIWTVITTVALANLLAVVAFVGWLASSDRLNQDRLESIRALLSETVEAEQTRLDEEAREQERLEAEAEAARRAALPPLTAGDRLLLAEESEEAVRQRLERMRREMEDLQRTIRAEANRLDDRTDSFEAEKAAFEQMRDRIAAIEGDEQFKKTVTLLEGLPPARASEMLMEIIAQGAPEQATAYLNAMQSRNASKVLASIEDPALAADLLERLRVYGLEARAE